MASKNLLLSEPEQVGPPVRLSASGEICFKVIQRGFLRELRLCSSPVGPPFFHEFFMFGKSACWCLGDGIMMLFCFINRE